MRQERAKAAVERAVALLAARQHGVVTARQVVATGIAPNAISRRVEAGRLYRVHHGVYAVGHHNLSQEGRWMAAVLAAGEGAVLSHRSAAALWALLPVEGGPIDITVPTPGGRRRRRGLRIHRSTCLEQSVVARRRGIPVTTPNRTVADLRRVSSRRELERAVAKAEFLGLSIERKPDLIHEPTRSVLERDFLRLCRRHRLPKPEVNARVGPYEVDFLWRAQRLVVEVDGYEGHRTRSAFEADRARDVRLKLYGYEVVRFTYWQVRSESGEVARAVRELLRRGGG